MSSIIERAIQEINAKYGESVTEIIIDGNIKRTGKKEHVWYVGHEWEFKGQLYQSINYGSWRHSDNHTLKSWDYKTEAQKGFRQSLVKHTQDAKIRLESEIAEKHQNCKLKWGPIFKKAKPGIIHPYLKYKGIDNAYLSRTDANGVLLIPAYNIDGFVGVQRIYEDPETREFAKRFSSGIEIRGAFCPLAPFKDAPMVYVSEGFATAASIQMAYPGIPSLCVWNSGNIPAAIGMVRSINPTCRIVIAADRDQNKVGEKMAKKAADAYPNVIYRLPTFPTQNANWTDFNDLHQFGSLDLVREQLKVTETDFLTITHLGYLDNDYFYTSNCNNQIIKLSASAHQKLNFYSLAPADYWEKHYGVETDDGVIVAWSEAASDMMAKCRANGLYNPEKVRGRGVWKEGDKAIINDGEKIFPELKDPSYHYQKLIKSDYSLQEPFSDEEMDNLLAALATLRYKNQQDYIYLAAWLVQGCVFATLPWRFHVWLTGDRGNGKSTILKWMHKLLPAAILTNNASAAGVRQDLRNDAFPTVFDETEPDGQRMKGVIELARQMSSNGEFRTLRGTTSGKAIAFNTQTVFLLGSIQLEHFTAADSSRIFVVDMLATKGQDQDEYQGILERMEYFEKNKNRFFSRCFHAVPSILKSTEVARRFLVENTKMEARLADQLATLIACFWVFASTEPITAEQVNMVMENYDLGKSDYLESNKGTDSEECFNELMSVEVDREGRTVAVCINKLKEGYYSEVERMLAVHGIRYISESNELFVASKSQKLRDKMKKFPDYSNLLRRDWKICSHPEYRGRIEDFRPGKVIAGIKIRLPKEE